MELVEQTKSLGIKPENDLMTVGCPKSHERWKFFA
jgi:hypothetical protein